MRMKRIHVLVFLAVLLLAAAFCTAASADTYGTLNQKMATRTGPGTRYDEPGTFFGSNYHGQRVRVISRANTGVWWLQVEFTYKGEKMRAYTGLKRVDGVNLNRVPEESVIGTCNTSGSVTGYYGPGTDYRAMKYAVPGNTRCDVIMAENGYLLVEFPYTRGKYQKSRAWVPEHAVSTSGDFGGSRKPDSVSTAREGTFWWTQEPQWSSCKLHFTSNVNMTVELFFYRIATINGMIHLDSGSHGTFRGWFDDDRINTISGEVWFTSGGVRFDINAYQTDVRRNGGWSSFYQQTTFEFISR